MSPNPLNPPNPPNPPEPTPSGPTYSYAWFIADVLTRRRPHAQRPGQWLFNSLALVRSDLAEAVCGTDIDPFHVDVRIARCLAWLEVNWNRRPTVPPADHIARRAARRWTY